MAGHPAPEGITQLGLESWGLKTLLSAVELGLFAALAKALLDAGAMTQRLGLHRRHLRQPPSGVCGCQRRAS